MRRCEKGKEGVGEKTGRDTRTGEGQEGPEEGQVEV